MLEMITEQLYHKDITIKDNKNIIIRKVKKEDLNSIELFFDTLSDKDKEFLALSYKLSVIKIMITHERHCYIALIQNMIVGFIFESGRSDGFSLLEEIVVHPRYRRKGIAQLLLDYYHRLFNKTLAKTNAKNNGMITLLKRNGYIAENPDAQRIINWKRIIVPGLQEITTFHKSICKDFRYNNDESDEYTRTVQEFEKKHYGVCYDTVNYTYFKLKHLNPRCFWLSWYIEDDKGYKNVEGTHTIIIFPENILCEISFIKHQGVYRFPTIYDAINFEYDALYDYNANTGQKFYRIIEYIPQNKKQTFTEFSLERISEKPFKYIPTRKYKIL